HGHNGRMDVLSARMLLRPSDLAASQHFYRDVLGLAVAREFGDLAQPGMVFFMGNSLLEVSGADGDARREGLQLWMQVRDVAAEHRRLVDAGATILREPRSEPWGLIEMWIADPDGVHIVLVEIPDDHPIRRDQRRPEDLDG